MGLVKQGHHQTGREELQRLGVKDGEYYVAYADEQEIALCIDCHLLDSQLRDVLSEQ